MAELKTKKTTKSVAQFIKSVEDAQRRKDCEAITELMKKATKSEPKMWGEAIVGFGDCTYKYDNGREMDWFMIGFSPRKQNLTLYFMGGLAKIQDYLDKLGKHKTGKGCLYINKLTDVDQSVLVKMINEIVKNIKS